jgi:serine/threonine protein phosphatase 1
MNIFAIGDVHGCLSELTALHKKILTHNQFNPKNDLIIYLGDYIDRGKNSKEVIDQIIKLKRNNLKIICLMGNHEEFMLDFLFNKSNNIEQWVNFGLDQTLRSYDIELVDFIKSGFGDDIIDNLRNTLLAKMSEEHINFFKELEISFSSEKYLFVHAGIDPKKSLRDQSKKDYLWSRSKNFFDKNFKSEKIIVHGHTPELESINYPFRINIDTGCYFSGKLSSVCLSDYDDSRLFINNLLK